MLVLSWRILRRRIVHPRQYKSLLAKFEILQTLGELRAPFTLYQIPPPMAPMAKAPPKSLRITQGLRKTCVLIYDAQNGGKEAYQGSRVWSAWAMMLAVHERMPIPEAGRSFLWETQHVESRGHRISENISDTFQQSSASKLLVHNQCHGAAHYSLWKLISLITNSGVRFDSPA